MRRKWIATLLAAVAMALVLTACGGAKLDMEKYVTVSFVGSDERGRVQISTDYDTMAEVVNKSNKSNGSLAGTLDRGSLSDAITYSCDKEEGLKNGDTVTVTVNVPEELMKSYDFSVSNTRLTVKVENLAALTEVDAFADINLHFSGCAPFATASLENNSDSKFLQNVTYELDKDSNLKNGDVVTVTAVYSDELVEQFRCIPETDTKEYTVRGLDSFITSFDDLKGNALDEVLADSRDRVEALIASKETVCKEFTGIRPYNMQQYVIDTENLKLFTSYLLVSKGEGFNAENNNVYVAVYHTTGDMEPNRYYPSHNYHGDMYFAVTYRDLEMGNDGKVDVDLTNVQYTYFTNEDDAYNDWMTCSKDRYKVYEQKAGEGTDIGEVDSTADTGDASGNAAESAEPAVDQ